MNWFKLAVEAIKVGDSMKVKGWFRSKTIWANILTLASGVLVWRLGPAYGISIEDQTVLAGGIVAASNIILRWKTNTPVALRDVPDPDNPTGGDEEDPDDLLGI